MEWSWPVHLHVDPQRGRCFVVSKTTKIAIGSVVLEDTPLVEHLPDHPNVISSLDFEAIHGKLVARVLSDPRLHYLCDSGNNDNSVRMDSLRRRLLNNIFVGNLPNKGFACFLYPVISSFNHSCWPELCINPNPLEPYNTTVIALQSSEDMSIGAENENDEHKSDEVFEVTICYDHDLLTLSTSQRRLQLKSRWGFDCHCRRCSADDAGTHRMEVDRLLTLPLRPLTSVEFATIKRHYDYIYTLNDTSDMYLNESLQFLGKKSMTSLLSSTHWRVQKVRRDLIPLLLGDDDSLASLLIEDVITAHSKTLPPLHSGKLKWIRSYIHVNTARLNKDIVSVSKSLRQLDPHIGPLLKLWNLEHILTL